MEKPLRRSRQVIEGAEGSEDGASECAQDVQTRAERREAKKQRKEARKVRRIEQSAARITNISGRHFLSSTASATSQNWLQFVINLFLKSPELSECFFRALDPHPSLAIQSIVSAMLFDGIGNCAPADHPIVQWLQNLSISFFLLRIPESTAHALDWVQADRFVRRHIPSFILPAAVVLDYFLAPIGDLQRKSLALEDESYSLLQRCKDLQADSQQDEVSTAEETYRRCKENSAELRKSIGKHSKTTMWENNDRLVARLAKLEELKTQLAEALTRQSDAKKALDKARRANKLDKTILDIISSLKQRSKECKELAKRADLEAEQLIQRLGRLRYDENVILMNFKKTKSAENTKSAEVTESPDSQLEPLEWPINLKTASGHNLCHILHHPIFKEAVFDLLRKCWKNIRREYGSRDFQGDLKPTQAGQNYHPFRAAWRDFVKYPLLFLKCIVDQKMLETDSLVTADDNLAKNDNLDIQPSFTVWKSLMIATVMREKYQRDYDSDIRVLCYGSKGARRSTYVFNGVFQSPMKYTETRNYKTNPIFNLPTRRALTEAQQEAKSDRWYFNNFRHVAYINSRFMIGSPPLQQCRPLAVSELSVGGAAVNNDYVPRFRRVWSMLCNAQPGTDASVKKNARSGLPSNIKRRKLLFSGNTRGINGSARFIFIPPKDAPCIITVERDNAPPDQKEKFVLPAVILSWVEREGHKCVVVNGMLFHHGRWVPRFALVIDEQGLAYPTTHLTELKCPLTKADKFIANSQTKRGQFSNVNNPSWLPGQGDIIALLRLLEAGPKTASGFLGKLAGSCCCCGLTLKAKKSLERGVGPVCAKRFTLSAFTDGITGYTLGDNPLIHLAPCTGAGGDDEVEDIYKPDHSSDDESSSFSDYAEDEGDDVNHAIFDMIHGEEQEHQNDEDQEHQNDEHERDHEEDGSDDQ